MPYGYKFVPTNTFGQPIDRWTGEVWEIGKWKEVEHPKKVTPYLYGFHLCNRLVDVFHYHANSSILYLVEYGGTTKKAR